MPEDAPDEVERDLLRCRLGVRVEATGQTRETIEESVVMESDGEDPSDSDRHISRTRTSGTSGFSQGGRESSSVGQSPSFVIFTGVSGLVLRIPPSEVED